MSPRIVINSSELNGRGSFVQTFLRPISNVESGPTWQPKTLSREYIVGTHDGAPTSSDYRNWRFDTFVTNFRAMYFERWIQISHNRYYLDRAYLSIYKADENRIDETELWCLHCDPNEDDSEQHWEYKRGPHMHICLANSRIPHDPMPSAHIPLNKCHLDDVLSSITTLSNAMASGVLLFKEQLLDQIR